MCMATIKFKKFKKKCVFFVVLGNSQALLGMPDMATLSIINLNIYTIQNYTEGDKGMQNKERAKNAC